MYEQFKNEGRLLTDNWKYYDHSSVVFQPRNMSPYELQTGVIRLKKQYCSTGSIFKRLPGNMAHPFLYLAANIALRQNVRNDIKRLPDLTAQIFQKKNNVVMASALSEAA